MKNLVVLILIVVFVFGFYTYKKSNPKEIETVKSSKITTEQAVTAVKNLPEVGDYLKKVPDGKVEVDNEEDGKYNVHVYEVKNGHTATFNWYLVGVDDGKVEEQFPLSTGVVSGKLCYPSDVIPKGTIEAKRVEDGKLFTLNFAGSENEASAVYKFQLEEGNYFLRFKTANSQSGYSTTVCPTGKEETCGDTKMRQLRKASVIPDQTISGYDLCDYFYKNSNAPKF